MQAKKHTYIVLALIVMGYVVIGSLYAIYTPPWQSPDEPAHYNVIRQIAADGCCPIITADDWDLTYLTTIISDQFPEGQSINPISYEDHQPPLYYLIAAPVYSLAGGNLIALRLLSVMLGSGVVLAAYFAGARLVPHNPAVGLGAAVVTAFVPQHVAILASVNNDSLALMLMGIIIVVALGYARNPVTLDHTGKPTPRDLSTLPHAAALGGLVGVAYLTKLTIYLPATLVVATAIIARWRMEKESLGWLVQQVAWAAGLAVAFGLPLWIRNATIYGFPDIFGLTRHAEVVVGQTRTAEVIADVGTLSFIGSFIRVTFNSFWGQFGWMAVPLPRREYQLILVFLAFTALGWVIGLMNDRPTLQWPQRIGLWILGAAVLGALINYGVYNAKFYQLQGRYLYPLMLPFAVSLAAGWAGWATLLKDRFLAGRWLPLAAMAWLPFFAVWALIRHVIPNLN